MGPPQPARPRGLPGRAERRRVDLYLDRQGVDTSTPVGEALFQMLGVFAEFEPQHHSSAHRGGHRQSARARHQERQADRQGEDDSGREAAIRAALGERQGHPEGRA
jgi:DNA invertase Pin-like site-specific DNA recombinase